MVSKGRDPSSGTDNTYFKPVDSSHEFKFLQVDTKFSYVDVDFGPEFIGLDPIPDLIEVDIGPSAVSQNSSRVLSKSKSQHCSKRCLHLLHAGEVPRPQTTVRRRQR